MKGADAGLKVVDIKRPTKKRTAVQIDERETPCSTSPNAYCPDCKITTPMLRVNRRVSKGIAITSGTCADCGRGTYRVGSVGSLSGDLG